MVVRWEGGAPPDRQEWVDVLSDALGQESGFYWVRFYRQPGGWRFDLERHFEAGPDRRSSYRRADESAVLRAFAALVESGKRLDPGWSPSAASPPAVVVRIPAPAAPSADAAPLRDLQRTAPETPAPADDMRTTPFPVVYPASRSRPRPLTASAAPAHRVAGRRGLRLLLVTGPALLLVGLAWWLLRDNPWPTGPAAAPSPSAVPTELAPEGHEEPEGTTQPSPQSAPPAGPPPPVAGAVDRPSTPAPTRRPAAPPPPARHGELADVNDPGLTPPVVVSQSCPPYPPLALERGLSGTVSLTAVVDETGDVVEVSRVRASPPGLGFEEAATSCVVSRVYRPATRQDVPVRVRLPIRVEFQPPRR